MPEPENGQFHALLIAIDNYDGSPLAGCVNDIDQVQRFLIDRLATPDARIRRLEAPIDPLGDHPVAAECLPTYENIVGALHHLASTEVRRGDRVLVYYSGHGSYQKVPAAAAYCEGLVPLDHDEKGLLLDVELNHLLQAIAERCGDLSVVLDCCHSAGATRDVAAPLPDSRPRFLAREQPSPAAAAAMAQRLRGQDLLTRAAAPVQYTVIAACHADETAAECRMPPRSGRTQGLFTYSLFAMLNQLDAQVLGRLRFSDLWEPLKAKVNDAQPGQRPVLLGPPERRIFGGPWQPQDAGYAIARQADGSYLIRAGSLAGLGPDAQLAVYGVEPLCFPPLDSSADKLARLGVLVVASVKPAEAIAWPVPRETPFDLPPAARGRLIKQGTPDFLRVALPPNLDPELRRFLDRSALLDNFLFLAEDDVRAEVKVGQYENGDLWIGDDLFGPGPLLAPAAPGPLGQVRWAHADDPVVENVSFGLRAGLRQYAQYVIPLRVYRQGGFTLPVGAVELKVLDCNNDRDTERMESDARYRHEAPRDVRRGCYVLQNYDRVAFQVQNTLAMDLQVHLLLCNMEGQIEFLAGDVLVRARSSEIFWYDDVIGKPFPWAAPEGIGWGIDRLLVIATDRKAMNLFPLHQKLTMDVVIRGAMQGKAGPNPAQNPPGLNWVVAQTLLQIGDRPG